MLHAKYQMSGPFGFREEDVETNCWRKDARTHDGQTGITKAHLGTLCQVSKKQWIRSLLLLVLITSTMTESSSSSSSSTWLLSADCGFCWVSSESTGNPASSSCVTTSAKQREGTLQDFKFHWFNKVWLVNFDKPFTLTIAYATESRRIYAKSS